MMALKKCDPIDPDKYGRNSHLGGIYCDHNVPVHMINRLLEEGKENGTCSEVTSMEYCYKKELSQTSSDQCYSYYRVKLNTTRSFHNLSSD
jgi:hypothetical protein